MTSTGWPGRSPVAIFFISIVLMLIGMTVWELKSPTTLRRGFLPMETTRGDRLFIGLLSAAYIQPGFRRAQQAHDRVVRARERAFGVDQLPALDGVLLALDHAARLSPTVTAIRVRSFPGTTC